MSFIYGVVCDNRLLLSFFSFSLHSLSAVSPDCRSFERLSRAALLGSSGGRMYVRDLRPAAGQVGQPVEGPVLLKSVLKVTLYLWLNLAILVR